MIAPRYPWSAIFRTRSRSKWWLRSFSRARGTISLSVKSRAVSRISFCSSVRSKSMATAYYAPDSGWSPTAASASAGSLNQRKRTAWPSRTVHTWPWVVSVLSPARPDLELGDHYDVVVAGLDVALGHHPDVVVGV